MSFSFGNVGSALSTFNRHIVEESFAGSATYGDYEDLLGPSRKATARGLRDIKVTSVFQTLEDLYSDESLIVLETMLTSLLSVETSQWITSIFSPYMYSRIQIVELQRKDYVIIPAQ